MEIEDVSEIVSEISFCDWAHGNKLCTYSTTGCSDCEISQAKLKTLAALREKQERENPQPLTDMELCDMENKPVYIRHMSGETWSLNGWHIWEDGIIDTDNYGKTWLAYRYPPKEGDKL